MTVDLARNLMREWLEADGLGGFASGTAAGVRTRRYHGLLLAATRPPAERVMLVNGYEAWLELPEGRVELSSHHYAPDTTHPDGVTRLVDFAADPWPRWTHALPGGRRLVSELFVPHGHAAVTLGWRLEGGGVARLHLRLLLSGRDFHTLQRENGELHFNAVQGEGRLTWQPYAVHPPVVALTDAAYRHEPQWYRQFLYTAEQARGLDAIEDLASPGVLSWDLGAAEARLILTVPGLDGGLLAETRPPAAVYERLRASEDERRARLGVGLARAAESYLVRRGSGRSIIAGYPWFGDWGRDTFIALRGLCLARGRLADAGSILASWAGAVSEGMLPNRFPDRGDTPEYNSVDASLWFVVVVGEYFAEAARHRTPVPQPEAAVLWTAVEQILDGFARGTRYGVRLDDDGLLAAGVPGAQLTWMDAKVGDWVVTPRVGKPVEVQCLWLNALVVARRRHARFDEWLERGRASFAARFFDRALGHAYDVVDVDHVPGRLDASLRPNQIFAVGGLPVPLLEGEQARLVVDVVEARLWTPLGPRTLAPGSPGYASRYEGGVLQRDGAYHQGTVWPWLAGAFIEAWVRVRGGGAIARAEAGRRFLPAIRAHLSDAGIGHVSEIVDAELPHTERGCPFQAWSVGEWLRIERLLEGDD